VVVVAAAVAAVEVVMAVADGQVGRVALVAGATGLVGREVLAVLSADKHWRAIHVVGRSAPEALAARVHFHPVDFSRLPVLPPVDDVFIALGTTIKVAGSQEAFRSIDHDAVLAVARQARAAGATRLAVVSAMGADAHARTFYNRVKGETEDRLRQLGYPTLVIARPSLLVGDRAALAQPARLGERLMQFGLALFAPLLPADYRAIAATRVAAAMVRAVVDGTPGNRILSSGAMQP